MCCTACLGAHYRHCRVCSCHCQHSLLQQKMCSDTDDTAEVHAYHFLGWGLARHRLGHELLLHVDQVTVQQVQSGMYTGRVVVIVAKIYRAAAVFSVQLRIIPMTACVLHETLLHGPVVGHVDIPSTCCSWIGYPSSICAPEHPCRVQLQEAAMLNSHTQQVIFWYLSNAARYAVQPI